MNYSNDLTNLTFKDFLFNNRRNRLILYIAGIAMIIQFIIYKYYFPFANFIHNESFTFIDAAASNADISTYPIGYSKFLRLFNTFTKSDTALVAFQYIYLQASTLFLLFTLFYFYRVAKATQYILLGFMVLNPLFLYLANLVSPDALFASVSLTWFTLLLWIIHRPNKSAIIWQAITIVIAFTISYKALIYPVFSALAFYLSPLATIRKKAQGWSWGALLCFLFFSYTGYKYQLLTGKWQFAPYLGWLTANNALIAYREVAPENYKSVPNRFKYIDNVTRKYFKEPRNSLITPAWEGAGVYYMLNSKTPLVKYRDSFYKNEDKDTSAIASFAKWAQLGHFYKLYGQSVISQYPKSFATYFIWTNLRRYIAPPPDYLDKFNGSRTYISFAAHNWFSYKKNIITPRFEIHNDNMLIFYPIMTCIFNCILLIGIVYYFLLRGKQYDLRFNTMLLFTSSIWLLNMTATICAIFPALRSQAFIILVTIICAGLLIDWMVQLMKKIKTEAIAPKLENADNLIDKQALA